MTMWAGAHRHARAWRGGGLAVSVVALCLAPARARAESAEAPTLRPTVVDLSDDWVPRLFAGGVDPEGRRVAPAYAARFRALANDPAPAAAMASFGIPPAFGVLRARALDDTRRECHGRVDSGALEALDRTLVAWRSAERAVDRAAVKAMQARLACDGSLPDWAERTSFDRPTAFALRDWQRRHMLLPTGNLDEPTRLALARDGDELLFREALRALRARVVDATGLLEDGSALAAPELVVGRALDSSDLRTLPDRPPLPGGAPDLVARATQVAAFALGWRDAPSFVAAMRAWPAEGRGEVTLMLPAPPPYHGPTMALRAEIDRGDVWYVYPYAADGRARDLPVRRLPTFTLYARDGDRWVPLVRWLTTIGGWQRDQVGGRVGLRYEESPVGPRVWRDVIAAPAWLPAPGIPDRELVRWARGEGWVIRDTPIGPGPESAYGLGMVVHHDPPEEGDGPWVDEGIRTHGTGDLGSILRGDAVSHGCHRVFSHLAVRLLDFLLAHRPHVVHGAVEVTYRRALRRGGRDLEIAIDDRGFRYELDPPLPVVVLEGEVHGGVEEPPRRLRALPPAR